MPRQPCIHSPLGSFFLLALHTLSPTIPGRFVAFQIDNLRHHKMIWNKVVVLAILAAAAVNVEASTHTRLAAAQEGEKKTGERELRAYSSSSGKGKGGSYGKGSSGSSGGKVRSSPFVAYYQYVHFIVFQFTHPPLPHSETYLSHTSRIYHE